jgi:hypothetical protein
VTPIAERTLPEAMVYDNRFNPADVGVVNPTATITGAGSSSSE